MEVIEEAVASTSNQMNAETSPIETSDTTPVIDLTERVDVAKNTDLFKAIFLDSESENEEEEKEEQKDETLKTNVLSDALLPKIKAKKDGILSNLDLTQLAPVPVKNISESSSITHVVEDPNKKANESAQDDLSYGPKMPQMFINKTVNTSFIVEDSDDEWVEKGSGNGKEKKSSHKHKKKHKKDKHEHKKKHKHDKKKK